VPRRAKARALSALVTCLILVAAMVASARAATPSTGVQADPNSPASKEYAIPLGAARSIGQPRTSTGQPTKGASVSAAQLFGNGIRRAPGSTGTGPGAGGNGREGIRAAATHRPAGVPAPAGAGSAASSAGLGRPGGSGALWMLAIAAGVLAVGALAAGLMSMSGRRTRLTS
jgi:hypothetical protein